MTATAPAAVDLSADGELSHREVLMILSGLLMGMFLAALDQTVVATAIKTIGNDLHDLSAQAWVTTAFLISSTIAAPLFGKLSDIYGRKRLFMLAIVIFVAGSALCGLAQSMYELAAFRAFQGFGAGGIMPLALAIIADIIPPRRRARYQGYIIAVFASASVLGPIVGGVLAGAHSVLGIAGWRWIFYINVPLAVAALVVVEHVLHVDSVRRRRRIDWRGSVLLALGLVPLLIVAEQGQRWGWASASAFGCYVIGLTSLVLFIWVEHRMGDDALLPVHLFHSSTFSVASAQITVIGMAMFGGLSVIPLYLQIVKGASPTSSGLLLLPLVGGLMLATLATGRLTARTGHYKVFPVIGSALMLIGMVLMTGIGAETRLLQTDVFMAIFGIGLGMNMQSLVLAMQNSVDAKDIGVASAASAFFRSIGGAIGTAIFLSILFSVAGTTVARQYGEASHSATFVASAERYPHQYSVLESHVGRGLDDTSFLNGLAKPLTHPFFVGFSSAADVVFLVSALLLLVALALSVSLKEVPLRLVSGQQARAQAEIGISADGSSS